jgi:hypothetical protein
MDNFNLRKFLTEGKLHEAISPEEVRDMAQMVADAFTAEDAEGDRFSTYMVYKVGNIDGMSFELDTEATEQTPEDDAKYGTGEGWGGMFRVKPTDNGYEIRNSEKGGLVATMDGSGFTMLDAEQSKAEMGGDTDYMERRRETDDYMEEGFMDKVEDFLSTAGQGVDNPTRPSLGEEEIEEDIDDITQTLDRKVIKAKGKEIKEEDEVEEIKSNKMKKSELKEMIKAAMLAEAEKDEDIEDVEVEDEADVEVDADVDVDMGMDAGEEELSGDVKAVQDNLEAALEAARAMGDEKLADQIGNSITFFTRQHIVKEGDMLKDEAELELEEAMSDDEIKDMARKQAFGKGLPEDLIEPAINIIVDMIRSIEALGIDPQKELDDQDVSPEQLGKLMPLVKDMQEKLFALVDNYTDSKPKEKSHFEKRLDKMRAQQNESTFPMWNKIK